MSQENSAEISAPNRRALLKAAVAGGAFAVPLIASFSMDAASAKTTTPPVIVSNMICSNMTAVPNAQFYAQLQRAGFAGVPVGPVTGYAGFEFTRGRNYLSYQFEVPGQIANFIITGGNAGFLLVESHARVGQIPESQLDCGPSGLNTLYGAFASGQASLEVELTDGTNLTGMIGHLGPNGPFFSF